MSRKGDTGKIMAEIRFQAGGTALSAFRDALRREGIACKGQQIQAGEFYAACSVRDEPHLRALAETYAVTLTILHRSGLRYRLAPYRYRFGILFGFLLGGMLIYWCNAGIRQIEITGNERVSDDEVLHALAELGVQYGTRFRDLPYTYLEQRMRLSIHDIEWITMRHTGGRLIVDMTEERLPPEMVHNRMPANLIAAVPAQITKVDVRGGHAVCKAGDTVKAGAVLITGVQEDARGFSRYYHADGIVRGIYTAEFTEEQPFVAEIPVRGQTQTETVLSVFGKRLPMTFGFRAPEDLSQVIYEEDADPLMLFGRRTPLTVLHCRYTPRETAITVFSEAEARKKLEESAARYEQNFHAEDVIMSREAEFTRTDLGISLKINYVFEGVIGKSSEIFVKLS